MSRSPSPPQKKRSILAPLTFPNVKNNAGKHKSTKKVSIFLKASPAFGRRRFPTKKKHCSGCRVAPPDRAAGARTRQPENSKRAHLSVPALQTPPEFHEKTTRERRKNEISGGREQKKRDFGPPNPSGPQPFGSHFFWVWAPPLRAPTPPGPHPSGPPPKTKLAKCGIGQIRFGPIRPNKDGQNRFGQMRSRPFWGQCVLGFRVFWGLGSRVQGFGVLGFWGFGVLGFWGFGVLGFWGFRVLGF